MFFRIVRGVISISPKKEIRPQIFVDSIMGLSSLVHNDTFRNLGVRTWSAVESVSLVVMRTSTKLPKLLN